MLLICRSAKSVFDDRPISKYFFKNPVSYAYGHCIYQPAAEGGRRRLYSLLTMRDSLTIKIDVKLILIDFES